MAGKLTFSADESGNLLVNGKKTSLTIPAADALVAAESFAETLQKRRAEQAQEEMAAALSLALEKGVFYLEDAIADEDERQ